ncbi:MAG: sodium-dependent bicarbonate transport family permease [Pseudomonadota bacterium]
MNADLLASTILNPAVLFFFLGILAALVRSDLEIPQSISKLMSLYLLLAIGFKGGVELSHSDLGAEIALTLFAAVAMSALVPVYTFFLLRRMVPTHDAAAIAATYGSISAVTFITAVGFLQTLDIPSSGYLVAAMALMESPAIIVGLILYRFFVTEPDAESERFPWGRVLREACFNGSVFLILGSLVIGLLSTDAHAAGLAPFTVDLFKGVLTLFLLDMGLIAGRRLSALGEAGIQLIRFALLVPLVNAGLGIALATLIDLDVGDSLLLTVLCASASYIAVPAAMRLSIPQANASLYVTLSLAVTFPFNIVVGLPLYLAIIRWVHP